MALTRHRFIRQTAAIRPTSSLIFIFGGHLMAGAQPVGDGSLVLLDPGPALCVEALDAEVRFLLISGKSPGEPVAMRGPIVMNTQAEPETAFREYREGSFIKPHAQSE